MKKITKKTIPKSPPKPRAKRKLYPDWAVVFLGVFRNTANIRLACEAANVLRDTCKKLRQSNEAFAAAFEQARQEAIDTLEAAALKRARDGVRRERPIFYKGEQVGTEIITEYSDSLMMLLLKSHRPEVYRDRVDITFKGDKELVEEAIKHIMEEGHVSRKQAIQLLAKTTVEPINDLVN